MSALQSDVCSRRPVAPKPRPEKENHVNTDTKPVVAKPEAAPPSKTRKAASRPPESSRAADFYRRSGIARIRCTACRVGSLDARSGCGKPNAITI